MKIWQLLCCMVLALLTIDKDRSFCHQSATPSLRDTKFYWLTFITGELSSFSVTMTNLALHYLRPAQIKNGRIFTRVWWVKSRNSDFIFSRRNDQIQPLPLNDDEIRWSRVKLEFFVAKNHAAARSSEGNGQIMNSCSIPMLNSWSDNIIQTCYDEFYFNQRHDLAVTKYKTVFLVIQSIISWWNTQSICEVVWFLKP